MKKIVIGMMAIASFVYSASAQETEKIGHHKHRHGKMQLMKGLQLSDSQKEQLKASRENSKKQLSELNKNEDITVREYRARKKSILDLQKQEFEKVLTKEQKDQLAQNKIDRQSKRDQFAAKKLDKVKTSLNLSDDQVAKIKEAREDAKMKAKAIRENSQIGQEEKKEQLMALKQEKKNNFKQLLSPEQINKLEELKKNRQDKRGRK